MKYLIQHFLEDSFTRRSALMAVKQGAKNITYGEIDDLAKRYQTHFKNVGLRKGDRIGIFSQVRVEAIAAMIAALSAGIIYVPLNIYAPTAWLGPIIVQASIRHLLVAPEFLARSEALFPYGLTCRSLLGEAEKGTAALLFSLQDIRSLPPAEPQASPGILADDVAYILFTSGSTGDPKGIIITHRNCYTFVDWMYRKFAVNTTDRVLSRAPLQFDVSVFDIFTTLMAGGCLVIPEIGFSNRADAVVDLMIQEAITLIYTVPSAYIAMLTKGGLARGIQSLRWILYAGEPFPTPFLRRVMQCLPGTGVANLYGPSETNVVLFKCITELPPADEPVAVGNPIPDTEVYIVDEHLNLLPDGEIGEILVRGGSVFAGYLKKPALTAECLIKSPFHDHPTDCCRTGDYGRVLNNGEIAYHGRKDNMVKTRGYRVELGEIESAISGINGVMETAVIPKAHPRYGNSLHAFVVLDSTTHPDLKLLLHECLPSYMVPFEFYSLPVLPKTATGKIDRAGLLNRLLAMPDSGSLKMNNPLNNRAQKRYST